MALGSSVSAHVCAASIIVHGAHTKNVYFGGKPALIEEFADELPGVTLEHFLHLTSIVRLACSFSCPGDMLKAALRSCCCRLQACPCFWAQKQYS